MAISAVAVYVELGRRRVFAGALEWPGWCRSGRDEDSALEALVAYAPRYAAAIGPGARRLKIPSDVSALRIAERLEGNATTDFGAPAIAPALDGRPLKDDERERLVEILIASWSALDVAADAASSAVLRTGPRGGGRELDAIRAHVFEADRAYLSRLGGSHRRSKNAPFADELAGLRQTIVDALASGPAAQKPSKNRRTAPWTPRYTVRRSAWHALDHTWEIEDRSSAECT
ncbi:MAG: hypothetical protein M3P11_04820 [Actinomycetota bacterium]|nr:hypothetical protein [Actinomycetota bacterium]